MQLLLRAALVSFALGCAAAARSEEPADAKTAQGLEIFTSHVRLILAHNCVTCHGGDLTESDFDLTTREGLLKGGERGAAVVPGRADKSRLVKLLRHESEPKMPEEADKLSDEAIALVARWIDLGAPYDKPLIDPDDQVDWTERQVPDEARQFWAFQPLGQFDPPQVERAPWVRTPIDRFVLDKLEQQQLAPAPPADKRTLIRRAFLDLIGLPPTPEEVEAFLSDERPEAYAELVDRLLDSPHYGERWGRYWLDVARFAESHGFEQDYDRPHAYHYRDFVIQALNQDLPYDRFVRWQLAGDELEPDNPLALMATGFLGAGVFPTQITANEVERTRYDALDDMAATTGTAMLGLTIGCARCHDHKFDPIPQADYYRMVSVFTTTVRSNIDVDLDPQWYEEAKAQFDRRHEPLAAELRKFEEEELPGRLAKWEASRRVGSAHQQSQQDGGHGPPYKWIVLELADFKSQGGATFSKLDDGSLLAGGPSADKDIYTLVAHTRQRGITAIRLEALADPSMKKGGPGRADNGNFALSTFSVTAAPLQGGEAAPVKLVSAKATFDQAGLPASAAIDDDPVSSWAVDPKFGQDHAAVFETESDIGYEGGTELTFTLHFNNNVRHSIGRPRLSVTTAARPVGLEGAALREPVAAALAAAPAERTADQRQALLDWYRHQDPQWQALNQRVQEHLAKAPQRKLEKVMVCSEGVTPIRHHTQGADFFDTTHFLARGNPDQKVAPAEPAFPQVLSTAPEGISRWTSAPPEGWRTSYRRRALAEWITDTEHGAGHLLARVIVNRLWQHHFGRGLVATPNDFGTQGEQPSHPELLDWLARDLIAGRWRLKPLHKRIMTSAVYMQGSQFDEAGSRIDPENRLFWRYQPRRLEAEAIRDSILAACGALDRTMFGPGTLDEGHRRRSIYFTIKRSRLIGVLQLFDAPEPLVSVGSRPSTTVAPQALHFMNNPHVRSWVRSFAERLAPLAHDSFEEAIRRGYLLALSRPPSDEELAATSTFLEQQEAAYRQANRPDARQLALADFCQVLVSLNEFVYVN